jgi:hypothetical protein
VGRYAVANKERKDEKSRAKPQAERPTEIADKDLDPVAGGLRNVAGGVDGGVCVTG